jgi:flagellar M-ring protein FliF
MDVANKTVSLLKEWYAAMTPSARLVAGLLAVLVVVSLVILVRQPFRSADAYLLGGRPFTAAEITAVLSAFEKSGLNGAQVEGSRIRVPTGEETRYLAAMADSGALPFDFHDYLDKALADVGPFVPTEQRKELVKNAKQRELSHIIRAMPGVESASVQYDVRRAPGLGRGDIVTASVNVKPMLGHAIDSQRARALRHLVASAIAGMNPADVTVTDLAHNRVFARGSDEAGGGDGAEHAYISVSRVWRQDIEERVHNALMYVPGVTVSAFVELNPELQETEQTTSLDDKASGTLQRIDRSDSQTTESAPPQGRPGLAAQQPGANQPTSLTSSRGTTSTSESTFSDRRSIPGHTTTTSRRIGLTPKRVTVAVGIPSNYLESIWQKRNPPAQGSEPSRPAPADLAAIEQEEIAKIRRIVSQLIPVPPGTTNLEPLVQVAVFESLASSQPPATPWPEMAWSWLARNWSTLAMIVLALVSLRMVRGLLRAPQPQPVPAPSEAAPPATGQPDAPEAATTARPPRRWQTGGNLRDDLTALVKSDPDTAANILKGWIGSAS